MKNISFLSENFLFLEVKISIYLNRRVFVMLIHNPNKINNCRYKMPKLERGRSLTNLIQFSFSQIVCSSSPVSSSSFKALAQILFKISCSQDFVMTYRLTVHESTKGHKSRNIPVQLKKKNIWVHLFLEYYITFQDPICNCSWPYAKNGQTNDKHHKVICPSTFFEVGA